MSRHVVVKNAAAPDLNRHEYKQHLESNRDRNQEVASHDSLGVIPDERPPMLRRGSSTSRVTCLLGPILAHGSRRNTDAQLQREFSRNPLFSPGHVLLHHTSNELADFLRQGRTTPT